MIRLLDIVISLLLLLVMALPMSIIAMLIVADDGFPILFRQTRVGLDRQPFIIYKFRSMMLDHSQERSGEVTGSCMNDKIISRQLFKTTGSDDPRVTSVGRFIRMTHLDELPQLLNVLEGEMSLVGVRPDTPSQEVDYVEDYWIERHKFAPGITGLAQVMNTESGGLAGREHWERKWIDQRSIGLYFIILMKTIVKVLKGSSF